MSDTATLTLADFLLARIAEDEVAAKTHRDAVAMHAEVWTPRRVLAESEAKRRIVELHTSRDNVLYGVDWDCTGDESDGCATTRALALPYSDHPDYRDEWRP